MTQPLHQLRALDEEQELSVRVQRLTVFLKSELAMAVPTEELKLMARQLGYMKQYLEVLQERIKAFRK